MGEKGRREGVDVTASAPGSPDAVDGATRLSPELRGGGGFTLEDGITAIYLSALLGETTGPGLGGRKVTRVALQQAAFGEPMDDVIIDATAADDSVARLSLQVKRALVISAARSNADFRDVVVKGSATLREEGFRRGVDRVGAATGTVAAERQRALEWLCARARASGGLVS